MSLPGSLAPYFFSRLECSLRACVICQFVVVRLGDSLIFFITRDLIKQIIRTTLAHGSYQNRTVLQIVNFCYITSSKNAKVVRINHLRLSTLLFP